MWDLVRRTQALIERFFPKSGENPALTARTFKGLRMMRYKFKGKILREPTIADLYLKDENGKVVEILHFVANPDLIVRNGLACAVEITAISSIDARATVRRVVVFEDGFGEICLNRFWRDFGNYALHVTPCRGFQQHGMISPWLDETEINDSEPMESEIERRINEAMLSINEVARSAIRRHLGKTAHPDQVGIEHRDAYGQAMASLNARIDAGVFTLGAS